MLAKNRQVYLTEQQLVSGHIVEFCQDNWQIAHPVTGALQTHTFTFWYLVLTIEPVFLSDTHGMVRQGTVMLVAQWDNNKQVEIAPLHPEPMEFFGSGAGFRFAVVNS